MSKRDKQRLTMLWAAACDPNLSDFAFRVLVVLQTLSDKQLRKSSAKIDKIVAGLLRRELKDVQAAHTELEESGWHVILPVKPINDNQ